MSLHEMFEKNEDEYGHFERIDNKLSSRPDLHAFILLNQLQPHDRDMVSAAEHDEIFLDIDIDKLLAVVTEDQVRDLARCGIRRDSGLDCLAMFV